MSGQSATEGTNAEHLLWFRCGDPLARSGRISAEVAEAESQPASDGEKLAQAKQTIDLALDLAKDCAASYRKARPGVRMIWDRAFFDTISVRDGAIADFAYEEPFASLLDSHNGSR